MAAFEIARRFFDACQAGLGWRGCEAFVAPDAAFEAQDPHLAGIDTVRGYCEWMQAHAGDGHGTPLAGAWDEARRTALFLAADRIGDGDQVAPVNAHRAYAVRMNEDDLIGHVARIGNPPHTEHAPSRARENKQLVDDMYAGINRNVLGIMQAYWWPDMVWQGPAGIGTKRGIDDFEDNYRRAFIHAFPDKHAEDIVRIAEGDWVAGTGYQDTTFAHDWLGIPATGERVRIRYMDFWRVQEDPRSGTAKLKENLVLIDILGLLEQAGYNVANVLRYIGSKPPEHFDQG